MPLYDYRCTACGREVEVMHGIHEQGPASCPDCGGAMRKALSPPAIHFKGSGWAKKDAAASSAKGSKPKSGPVDQSGSPSKEPASEKTTASSGEGAAQSSSAVSGGKTAPTSGSTTT